MTNEDRQKLLLSIAIQYQIPMDILTAKSFIERFDEGDPEAGFFIQKLSELYLLDWFWQKLEKES